MIGARLMENYVSHGPGVLRTAIERDPATKLILPLLRDKLQREFPLFAAKFEEDFHAELAEPATLLCRSDNFGLLGEEDDRVAPC